MRFLKFIPLIAASLYSGAGRAAAASEPAAPRPLFRLDVKGVINPPLSDHIRAGIAQAEHDKAQAVLLELDTPGGLLDSTREIVQSMLNSSLPVIVYIAPRGARATSAGVFLTMASDVAAMAPGTHLGAAHPVQIGGDKETPSPDKGAPKKTPSVSMMQEKAVSDAAAYIRVLASDKGRNAEWAERAVRESTSLTAQEALTHRVVELTAEDRPQLMQKLEGREILKHGKKIRLSLAGAAVRDFSMSPLRRILQVIANPNLALLFLMIGIYGLIYEFSSPGVGFGAVAGLTSLILAGYALSILPVNYAGLLLIGLAVILLVLEFQVPSQGLLTVGGLALLALGSFFLFDSPEPYLRVSLEVIGGTVLATGAFSTFAVRKIIQARHLKPAVGADALLGQIGETREALDPKGFVFVNSELWTAEAPSRIEKGSRVKVVGIKGNVLRVNKTEDEDDQKGGLS